LHENLGCRAEQLPTSITSHSQFFTIKPIEMNNAVVPRVRYIGGSSAKENGFWGKKQRNDDDDDGTVVTTNSTATIIRSNVSKMSVPPVTKLYSSLEDFVNRTATDALLFHLEQANHPFLVTIVRTMVHGITDNDADIVNQVRELTFRTYAINGEFYSLEDGVSVSCASMSVASFTSSGVPPPSNIDRQPSSPVSSVTTNSLSRNVAPYAAFAMAPSQEDQREVDSKSGQQEELQPGVEKDDDKDARKPSAKE
jgi:hypothetical protein